MRGRARRREEWTLPPITPSAGCFPLFLPLPGPSSPSSAFVCGPTSASTRRLGPSTVPTQRLRRGEEGAWCSAATRPRRTRRRLRAGPPERLPEEARMCWRLDRWSVRTFCGRMRFGRGTVPSPFTWRRTPMSRSRPCCAISRFSMLRRGLLDLTRRLPKRRQRLLIPLQGSLPRRRRRPRRSEPHCFRLGGIRGGLAPPRHLLGEEGRRRCLRMRCLISDRLNERET